MAFDSPCVLLQELQRRYKARTLSGVPQTPTTYANLDCAFIENPLVFIVQIIGRARSPLYDLLIALTNSSIDI